MFLHDSTGLPVIGISHTGHIGVGYDKHWSKIADLNQQVTDKIKYIKEYIAKKDGTKLNLIFIGELKIYNLLFFIGILFNFKNPFKRPFNRVPCNIGDDGFVKQEQHSQKAKYKCIKVNIVISNNRIHEQNTTR